jgi:hypothetical protein
MKPLIYSFETKFNFGKWKGKSLLEVLNYGQSRYIGYLIANNILWFVFDPETMNILERKGVFDDLEMSFDVSGGSLPLNGMGLKKEHILSILRRRYNDFINDPIAYEELAKKRIHITNLKDILERE